MQIAERFEIMTDFQAKMMLNMVIDIVREMKEPEEIIKRIIAIRDGTADNAGNKDEN